LTPTAPLAAAIFLMTVGLIIARPKRLTEAFSRRYSAPVPWFLAGLVPLGAAVGDVAGHWDVLFFFLGPDRIGRQWAERSGLFRKAGRRIRSSVCRKAAAASWFFLAF